jgi:hypothetical protein
MRRRARRPRPVRQAGARTPNALDQVTELIARAEADPGEWQVMHVGDERFLLRVVRLEGEAAERSGWLRGVCRRLAAVLRYLLRLPSP